MKYAQILPDNVVGNLIEGPNGFTPPVGWIECPIETEPGAVYDPVAGTFENPPSPVPSTISRFQARAALLAAGLLPTIEAAMADPAMDPFAKLAWDYAQDFNRASPTISGLQAMLGLTDATLDALFVAGYQIEA
jgi:hypothetical protein